MGIRKYTQEDTNWFEDFGVDDGEKLKLLLKDNRIRM
jgi:hypothetical protein